jgi:hypothetical protein
MGWLDKLVTVEKVEGKPEVKAEGAKQSIPIPQGTKSVMDTPLEDVLVSPGRNSADMVIKLREGLAAFPEPQQLAMLRAMDGADASWDEASVIADAHARLDALDKHMEKVQADARDQESAIQSRCAGDIQNSQNKVAELDQQIADLQKARSAAISQAAVDRANADSQVTEVKDKVKGITEKAVALAARYQGIIKFFSK